jgi:hypothetical protein
MPWKLAYLDLYILEDYNKFYIWLDDMRGFEGFFEV